MKRIATFLAVLALGLVWAAGARAQVLVTLDPAVSLGGGEFQYNGTITNGAASSINLTDAFLTLPGGISVTGEALRDLITAAGPNFPLPLAGEFFRIKNVAGIPTTGEFSVKYLDDAGGEQVASARFDIEGGPSGGQVPEPSAWATMMLGGSGLIAIALRSRSRRA